MTEPGGSLDITILAVRDLERSVTFYRRLLGGPPAVQTAVYVELPAGSGTQLGLYLREGFGRNVGRLPESRPEGSVASTELYLRVPDLSAAIAAIEGSGARLLAPRAKKDWGDEVAYFADPDGNVVALAERVTSDR